MPDSQSKEQKTELEGIKLKLYKKTREGTQETSFWRKACAAQVWFGSCENVLEEGFTFEENDQLFQDSPAREALYRFKTLV